ncbi:hypothetical protein HRR80_9617 [Exophiala dermatitidis]|uniref:Uncharacterized protein n=2 Tax=Exophiala dermatitidis TaxID=5970 RepID=H6C999_EXODN|nr:uncharacterized protein HMPREF1120_07841 [Exophiala dermatitidis NIH/UT8656]EHY59861.1 hypothetical protein HMPREF1120_07841 [Exophiala dermatitidis NIH/UT8656]KAJ4563159.1 hypothetical protein HRR82_009600 [Exophiala dermatitidis]KAJ8986473.1 hypothetical protein HRR80_9617 [Exophiala dermatitidis]
MISIFFGMKLGSQSVFSPRFLCIFLITDLFFPGNTAKRGRLVTHVAMVVSSMPMLCAWRAPDNIPNIDPDWLSANITYPTRPGDDSQDLTLFMRVPVRSGTWRESDIGNRHAFRVEDRVDIHVVAGKSICNGFIALNGGCPAPRGA